MHHSEDSPALARPIERLLVQTVALRPASMAWNLDDFTLVELLELAGQFSLVPLVTSNIRRAVSRGAMDGTLSRESTWLLDQIHARAVIERGLTMVELQRLGEALADLRPLLLKGVALESLCYRAGERLGRDIDIFIPEACYYEARSRLMEAGYEIMAPYDERLQRQIGKDVSFLRTDASGNTWSVELHWRVIEPGIKTIGHEQMWPRSVPVLETRLRSPNAADMLLLLALNLRKQRFARLKTVVDVDHLVRVQQGRIDWESLHETSHRLGVCVLLAHTLRWSQKLLGTPTEDLRTCGRLKLPQARLLGRMAGYESVFAEGRSSPAYSAVAGLLPFVSLDKPGTVLHLVWRRLFLSPEIASYRTGGAGTYRSRSQYMAQTFNRIARAGMAIPSLARHVREAPAPGNEYAGVARLRPVTETAGERAHDIHRRPTPQETGRETR